MALRAHDSIIKLVRCLCAVLVVCACIPFSSFASTVEVSNVQNVQSGIESSSGVSEREGISQYNVNSSDDSLVLETASDSVTLGSYSDIGTLSSANYSGGSYLRTASLGSLATKALGRLHELLGKAIPWGSARQALVGAIAPLVVSWGISTPAVETAISDTLDNPAVVVMVEDNALDAYEAAWLAGDAFSYEFFVEDVSAADAIADFPAAFQAECTSIADNGVTLTGGSGSSFEDVLASVIQNGVVSAGWLNSNNEFCQWLAQVIVGDSGSSSVSSGSIADVTTTSADYPINGVSLRYALTYPLTTYYSSTYSNTNWLATAVNPNNNGVYVLYPYDYASSGMTVDIYAGESDPEFCSSNAAAMATVWSYQGDLSLNSAHTFSLSEVNNGYAFELNPSDNIFVYDGTYASPGSLLAFYQQGVWTLSDGTVLSSDTSISWPSGITVIGDNASYDSTGAITDYGTVNAVGAASTTAADDYVQNLDASDANVVVGDTVPTSASTVYGGTSTVADVVSNPGTTTEDEAASFQLSDLEKVFPFCIPFDLYDMVAIFAADPEAPQFDWPVYFLGQEYDINVDLSQWDPVAATGRTLLIALFLVGLAFATRDLIRG